MTLSIDDWTEWLEADGLGGFASGTTSGVRTRRYHALLLTATTPPTGRVVLVNGFDAWVDTPAGSFALTTQRYAPDVRHPDGASRIVSFAADAPIVLRVRPFISGRDYHSMQRENSAFRFDAEQRGSMVAFRPYDGLPAAVSFTNGDYRQAPDWYRQFLYDAE